MDSPSRTAPSPSKVLAPVPPHRINQRTPSGSQHVSAEVSRQHLKSLQGYPDVQSKVAHLNNLSHGNSPTSTLLSSGANAAYQRAVLGREEAESSLASVFAKLSEAQSRERRISERLESLLGELRSAKERQAHERTIFEREIRKARKEAFRTSSALVKLQDELKASKTEIKELKDGIISERDAREEAKKESAELGDTITQLTKETEVLNEKLFSVKESNRSMENGVISERDAKEEAMKESTRRGNTVTQLTEEMEVLNRKLSSFEESDRIMKDDVIAERDAKERATKESTERGDTITQLTREIEVLNGKLSSVEDCNRLLTSEVQAKQQQEQSTPKAVNHKFIDSEHTARHTERTSLTPNDAVAKEADRERGLKRTSDFAELLYSEYDDETNINCLTPQKKQRVWSDVITPKKDDDTIQIESPRLALDELRAKLQWETRLRIEAEKTIDFLCLECQFKACRCRVAEREGREYCYDKTYKAADTKKEETKIARGPSHDYRPRSGSFASVIDEQPQGNNFEAHEDLLIAFSPERGTFHSFPSPNRSPGRKHATASTRPSDSRNYGSIDLLTQSPNTDDEEDDYSQFERTIKVTVPTMPDAPSPSPPSRPGAGRKSGILLSPGDATQRRVSTQLRSSTMSPPPRETEEDAPTDSFTPTTPISREAALAQIRARRGRAQDMMRSTSSAEGNARSGGMGMTPTRVAKRIPGLKADARPHVDGRERRDLRAPMKLFRR